MGGHNFSPPGREPSPQQGYLPCGRSSRRHALVKPLSAIISFPSLEGQPSFNVDVLDVSEGGLRLQLALPPDLKLELGQEGVISLVIRRSEPPHMYPFKVRWVEINSLISVAGVSFDKPIDLSGLPQAQKEVVLPEAGLIQSISMSWALADASPSPEVPLCRASLPACRRESTEIRPAATD